MRVILVGSSRDRARLRAQLDRLAFDVIGEFASMAAAREARLDADALMVASNGIDAEGRTTFEGRREREPTFEADELDAVLREPLTPREIQVLELLAEGLPNKAIAGRLRISDQTVKFHVASIAGKLGAANRTDIVRRAVRRGLIAL
jgi:DNA-binding NarL/FixJ family response regulator